MTRQFVALVPAQVAALGSRPAATVLAHLVHLTRRRSDGVVATAQDLADGTCLSLRTIHRATTLLREQGVVTATRDQSWSSTMRWRVVADHPIFAGQPGTANLATPPTANVAVPTVPPEGLEVDTAPLAPTEQGTLPFLVVVPDPPADPEPVDAGPPKTAQTLVARWVDGYRSVNGGRDPHRAVMGRVAGQSRNLAKACGEDHDAWVDAWHACYAAGVAGTHDLVRHLVPQQQRRQSTARRNVWAEPGMGGPGPDAMARFSAMMGGDQPRALGGGQ